MNLAYSYLRFSSPEQAKGDSLRRQTESREKWLAAHPDVPLDSSLALTDSGRSAFHRKDWDTYALAQFVGHVKSGRVRPGSYLLVENLDRLSREEVGEATELFLSLVNKGIVIVQLSPAVMEFRRPVDAMQLMYAIMELSRGHSESKMKSERIGAAWDKKRAQAREGVVITKRLPGWVEIGPDHKLRLIPHHAATVKRIFHMAASGYGARAIVKKLKKEGVPPFRSNWERTYVKTLLSDRRVLGEFQLKKGDGTPDGPPIPHYFPPAVTEQEWSAARSASLERDPRGGTGKGPRDRNYVDLFKGLLNDVRGGTMRVTTRTEKGRGTVRHNRLLVNSNSEEGDAPCASFPLPTFERAVLLKLKEVSPQEVFGNTSGNFPEVIPTLEIELSGVKVELDQLRAYLDKHGFSPTLGDRVTTLEARQKKVAAELEEAKVRAASPADKAWEEFRTLAEGLDKAPDPTDSRYRLRAALRRSVAAFWVLVLPRGRDRLAFVQVDFRESSQKRYLVIGHRPPRGNGRATQAGLWWCSSVKMASGVDLSKPEWVELVEELLPNATPEGLGDNSEGEPPFVEVMNPDAD